MCVCVCVCNYTCIHISLSLSLSLSPSMYRCLSIYVEASASSSGSDAEPIFFASDYRAVLKPSKSAAAVALAAAVIRYETPRSEMEMTLGASAYGGVESFAKGDENDTR